MAVLIQPLFVLSWIQCIAEIVKYHSTCGRDGMVVGFTTTITTDVVNSKFVIDLRQVSGFLQLLWFPPPIKLNTIKQTNKH